MIRPAVAADGAAAAAVFHSSREAAMPWLPVLHSPEEDVHYFTEEIASSAAWVFDVDREVVGFVIARGGWLRHLYVHPDHQGDGVGTALLARVLPGDGDELQLWVFERNTPARSFYEARGFARVGGTDGAGNEEQQPDILMRRVG
ncbi:MAG: GNAT family N-acetyltransferase [Actinobacteria bacterium]|nr:GNAT family N-acetyltransferase [Actinomycetota bacterium]